MTYEEKLDIVIKAIVEARKLARKGEDKKLYTKLYLTSDNELKGFILNELYDILLKLQDDEGIVFVQDIPSAIQKLFDLNVALEGKKDFFLLEIKDGFDSWYERRLIINKSRLENLSGTNLTNITHIVKLIEEQLELDQSEKITIGFISSDYEIEAYEKEQIDDLISTYTRSLTYLKNISVIKDYTTADMTLSSDLTLNIARFFEVLEQINKLSLTKKIIKKDETNEISKAEEPQKKEQEEINTTRTKTAIKVFYNGGVLNIEDKKVKLQKDSFRGKLLELLLKDDKNSRKEWSWDETIEEIEGIESTDALKESKKKFYPACDGLSKFIAQKTGVNDLLIYNKSTVQINPIYL